jgi:hypothetical protein
MNPFVQETSFANNFIYKIIDVSSIKVKPIIDNLCWFCNMKCSTFVKICDDCKYENYDKKRKIKKKN